MLPIKNFEKAVKSSEKDELSSSEEEDTQNELEETDGNIQPPSIEQSYRESKQQFPSSRRNSNKNGGGGSQMQLSIPKAPPSQKANQYYGHNYLDSQNTLTFQNSEIKGQ